MKRNKFYEMFGISYNKYILSNKLSSMINISRFSVAYYRSIYNHSMKKDKNIISNIGDLPVVSEFFINDNDIDIDIDMNNSDINVEFGGYKKGNNFSKEGIFNMKKINESMKEDLKIKHKHKKVIVHNRFKDIVKKNKGGYNAYTQNKYMLGNISDILDDCKTEAFERLFEQNVIDVLAPSKCYSILLIVKYLSDGQSKASTPMKSIIITKSIQIGLLFERFKMALNQFEREYQLDNYMGNCFICWREWLSNEDYLKGISNENVDEIVNEVLLDEFPDSGNIRHRGLERFININKFNDIVSYFPNFNSVELLPSFENFKLDPLHKSLYEDLNNYINIFNSSNSKFNIKNIYLFDKDNKNYLLFVITPTVKSGEFVNTRIILKCGYQFWESALMYWDSPKFPYIKWTDTVISDDVFTRVIGEYKLYIKEGIVDYVDRMYKFPNLRITPSDRKYNSKIGTIDLETFAVGESNNLNNIDDDGLGIQEVYAGGWVLNNLGSRKVIIDSNRGIITGQDVIKLMFEELFKLKVQGYTLYAHNLGRFDSIFLIKELCNLHYTVSPT
jgi:hypothetical protein